MKKELKLEGVYPLQNNGKWLIAAPSRFQWELGEGSWKGLRAGLAKDGQGCEQDCF